MSGHGRALTGHRLALAATVLATGLVAVAAVWPQALGVAGVVGPAQVVAVRGASIGAAVMLLAVLLALALSWRRARSHVLAVAAVVGLAAAASSSVVTHRGLDGDLDDDPSNADLRVLAFNTLRDGVPAADIATLVDDHRADIVVLPETPRGTAEQVARAVGGYRVRAHAIDGVTSATSMLIAADLGDYADPEPYEDGALASFTVRPDDRAASGESSRSSRATEPGRAPPVPIVAVHTYPPGPGTMDRWRADTDWAIRACANTPGAVVLGDFNATLDHPAFADLGPCVDAAAAAGAAAVGTWPTDWPAWAGAPIDHVLVDARAWTVTDFAVLDEVGRSDHRPVLAVLQRSG